MLPQKVVSYYARPASFSTGGVNTSRQQWMQAISRTGVRTLVVAARGGFDQQIVPESDTLRHLTIPHVGRTRMTMLPRGLGSCIRPGDLVYLHEGWTPSNAWAAALCRIKGADYIVMPHGVYAPELVSHLRHLPLRRTVERWVVKGSLAVHVFFEQERHEVTGLFGPITSFAITTGFTLPDDRPPDPNVERYLAWLGRFDIHHKGIDRLLEALADLAPADRPVLRMRGPDHRGDRARVAEQIRRLGLENDVELGPELTPEQSVTFLRDACGFVHLPRWEAFGRTIVEALSVSTPVLLSGDAQIAGELASAGVANVVDASRPEAIAAALREMWQRRPGSNPGGRIWVEQNLSWCAQAARLLVSIEEAQRLRH